MKKLLYIDGKECYLVKCDVMRDGESVWDDREGDSAFDNLKEGDLIDMGFTYYGDEAILSHRTTPHHEIFGAEYDIHLIFDGRRIGMKTEPFPAYPGYHLVDYVVEVTRVLTPQDESQDELCECQFIGF